MELTKQLTLALGTVGFATVLAGCGLVLDSRPDEEDASTDAMTSDVAVLDASTDDANETRDAASDAHEGMGIDAFSPDADALDAAVSVDAASLFDADLTRPDARGVDASPMRDWSVAARVTDVDVSAYGDSVIVAGDATIDVRYTAATGWVERRVGSSQIAAIMENDASDFAIFTDETGALFRWSTGAPVRLPLPDVRFIAGTQEWIATVGLERHLTDASWASRPFVNEDCTAAALDTTREFARSLDVARGGRCGTCTAMGVHVSGVPAVRYSRAAVPLLDMPDATLTCDASGMRVPPGPSFGSDVALTLEGDVLATTSADGPRVLVGPYRNPPTHRDATSVALGEGVDGDVLLAWTDERGAFLQALPRLRGSPCFGPSDPLRIAPPGANKVRISDCHEGEVTVVIRRDGGASVHRLACLVHTTPSET